MFTGIVQAKGTVARIDRNPFGVRLVIDRSNWAPPNDYQPEHGHSICISGVCLTVVEDDATTLSFDVIAETLEKTTLGDLAVGSPVNLEPSVTPNQPLGGHFMQGHVDGVGEITNIYSGEDEWRTTVKPPADLMPYVIPKGSVAIDGISLTLAAVHDDSFEVALIPTTLELTTLGTNKVGDKCNLEADIISKTIVCSLHRQLRGGLPSDDNPGVTMDLLREAGFAE